MRFIQERKQRLVRHHDPKFGVKPADVVKKPSIQASERAQGWLLIRTAAQVYTL
jgi:hypothetical protein